MITADELEQMPEDDSVQIELDEGELITIPSPLDERASPYQVLVSSCGLRGAGLCSPRANPFRTNCEGPNGVNAEPGHQEAFSLSVRGCACVSSLS
jgi:hypothetical protein